jgi:hypothetical protein
MFIPRTILGTFVDLGPRNMGESGFQSNVIAARKIEGFCFIYFKDLIWHT